jgi:hypothetical protein
METVMNILNKLKPTLLVTTIILFPTVSYAMEQDQGEHTGLSGHPNVSSQQPTQEEYDRAVEKALQNKAPMPIYPDFED